MAVNKRKILESAQKHLQKGAVDKALKEYQTLLKADPKDVNVRLKIGDLQLRLGQNEEAIEAYLKVAERFMADGFDAKAVALYKQIGRLDPKRTEVHLPLAELYQRLGLPSDAMGALQAAADVHFKAGAKAAGLELMRRMASLDPTNTTNRLKVAELLRQEGMLSEAGAEFEAVAREFEAQGDAEAAAKALEQVLAAAPDRADVAQRLARACILARRFPQAVLLAERAVAAQPDSVEVCELLADALRASGREEALPDVYRRMAALYKERGDEERMRDVLQRFVPGSIPAAEGDEPVLETDDELVFEEPGRLELSSPEPDPGFAAAAAAADVRLARPTRQTPGRDHGREHAPALRAGHALPPLPRYDPSDDATPGRSAAPSMTAPPGLTAPAAPRSAATLPPERSGQAPAAVRPAPGPEAAVPEPTEEEAAFDPDQLLAEANVYLRYGKHERAVESLRALLAQQPEHAQALVKLGEALEAAGQRGEALEAFCQAARLARRAGHAAPFEALRARVATLDAAAAASLGEPGSDDDDLLDDVDIDIETDLGGDEGAFGDDLPPAATTEVDLDARPAPAPEREPPSHAPVLEIEIVESDVEISESELGLADETPESTAPAAAAASPPPRSRATTAEQISAVLEEATFYQSQGLLDEAEAVCRRILAALPGQPLALLRLGEIAASRAALDAAAREAESAAELPVAEEFAADTTAPVAPPAQASSAPPPGQNAPPLLLDGEPSLPGESEPLPVVELELALLGNVSEPSFEEGTHDPGDVSEVTQNVPPAPAPPPIVAAPAPQAPVAEATLSLDAEEASAEEAGEFDLGKAISDTLGGESGSGLPGRATRDTEKVGIEEVFAAFKKGVERTLGAGDHEARYDLGIAYREMGLLEDALSEFRMALSGPSRRLHCLHMMGLCALDLGRAADAVAHLEQALSHADVPVLQQVAVRFDLARAYESRGDAQRALAAFEAVAAEDPGFCDVGERVAALRGAVPEERKPEPEEEGLESFDDFMVEDAPVVAEASGAEESVEPTLADELADVADAVAEPVAAESLAAEPAAAEPTEVAPDPPDEAGAPPAASETSPAGSEKAVSTSEPRPGRTGKRKKISFF